MARPEKFLFQTSFDERALAREAERAAEAEAAPSFGVEELAEAERKGYAAGEAAGRAEALAGAEQSAAAALSAIEQQLSRLGEDAAQSARQREERAIRVAVSVVRKLFPSMAAQGGLAEIEGLVEHCLASLEDEPRVVVRVPDAQLDALKARLDGIAAGCGFEGRIVLLSEAGLGPADARVEWADGGAEHDSQELWAEIDEVLDRALHTGHGGEPAAAADAPDRETGAGGDAGPDLEAGSRPAADPETPEPGIAEPLTTG
ncbi:MAG: FliH/SctL family protein [Kiloniellales bacterium]|nr:FliH/SctL family protein [Kiloniellales bacterium]